MPSHPPVHALAFAFALLLVLPACSPSQNPASRPSSEGRMITGEQIRRSGATDAWEALRRTGTHLNMREGPTGQPSRLSRRGPSSILLSNEPLVVIDGARMIDFRTLRQVPAQIIASIRILSGHQGTTHYGTGAGNGVIVVETTSRP